MEMARNPGLRVFVGPYYSMSLDSRGGHGYAHGSFTRFKPGEPARKLGNCADPFHSKLAISKFHDFLRHKLPAVEVYLNIFH